MSFSQRILFGNLPEDDPIRETIARSAEAASALFTVRARPTRPKRNLTGMSRDPVWQDVLLADDCPGSAGKNSDAGLQLPDFLK